MLADADACGRRFADIWKKLPAGGRWQAAANGGRTVAEECPTASGHCVACELLHRKALAPADPRTGGLEVVRLSFALPAGAVASDPAHVEVRAQYI